MIRLVQVRGEGYDLETGTRTPKALVLSNGVRTLDVPADDELVEQVLKMLVEGVELEEGGAVTPGLKVAPAPSTFEEEAEPVRLPIQEARTQEDLYEDELTGVGSI